MIERENILQEIWSRICSVDGVVYTARNPKKAPSVNAMPCIQMFELDDVVKDTRKRGAGQWPQNKRILSLVVELFVNATREEATTKELIDFAKCYKSKLYADGVSLGGLCDIRELSSGKVLRPPVGGSVSGIGFAYAVHYIEDVSRSTE